MTEIALSEFPFVSELPKREQKRVRSVWDVIREFGELQEREGALIPLAVAASALGVSRQRVWQITEEGERLRRVDFEGHAFVTEKSLIEFGRLERKRGRPFKVDLEK